MRWDCMKLTRMAVRKVDNILNKVHLMSYKRLLAVAATNNNFLDLKFFMSYGPPI